MNLPSSFQLRVSDNKRFLAFEGGSPFFYLADTAWELFHRCTRIEAEIYLQGRAAQGFNVVQAVVLAEKDGLQTPNSLGDLPLLNLDPTQPNEAYFQHVDFIVELAASLGIFIALLPTWGDKWNQKWGDGPEIFTPENARTFGEFLGKRYRDAPIIWVLGGDRPVENEDHADIIRAMAQGLSDGDGGAHLKTFHPPGRETSSTFFHEEEWLDFNMWQSGHRARNIENYNGIAEDYSLTPTKPVLDGEPNYEDHPVGFDIDNGFFDDYDNRKAAYWSLFSGACGHTYGCHAVWQMFAPGRASVNTARRFWMEALNLPGANQMQHAKNLLLSRSYFSRVPDQTLIVSEETKGSHHIRATRDENGSYALIYFPSFQSATIDLEKLSGQTVVASWFDPRNGVMRRFDSFPLNGARAFEPPHGGPDWVLVLDAG